MKLLPLVLGALLNLVLIGSTLWNPAEGNIEDYLLLSSAGPSFDYDYVNVALYHSQSVYCDPNSYLEREYRGILSGFNPTYVIKNEVDDTHGYIGYTGSPYNTIYVVFRGSESTTNWMTDLNTAMMDYQYCDGCEVHKGFYTAQQDVIEGILYVVKTLQNQHPTYRVVVTGHSLGGALATYTAMDLHREGVSKVHLINFGSPRCGNKEFANWITDNVKNIVRVTHHKDIAVHCPMTSDGFRHVAGEWYEPDDHVPIHIKSCEGKEDPECSYQWEFTSTQDHLWYLGLNMGTSHDDCDSFV